MGILSSSSTNSKTSTFPASKGALTTTMKTIKPAHRVEGTAVESSKSLHMLRQTVCKHRGATGTELVALTQAGGTKMRPLFIKLLLPNTRNPLRRMMRILKRMSRKLSSSLPNNNPSSMKRWPSAPRKLRSSRYVQLSDP